ncbi:retrovirus-related pol polyprotein from transposon TNT 1-94 [Tanacetum coccineum]
MLEKEPNKVYDPFLKAGLGYKNPERLKKAIAAQPKMYDGEMLHITSLKIHSSDSEETLEDAEESRLKMRNKMVKLNHEKLNALYETFVPQQEPSVEQTYFSIPSTSNDCSKTKKVTSDLSNLQMPKESKLLKMFEKMGLAINNLQTRIDVTLLEDRKRRWMSDSQNSLREFYKTDVIPMSESLSMTLKELQQELIDEVQEMLNIFESMEQKVAERMSKLSTVNKENVLLKTQVDSVVKERENIKLEYQKLFNSIKATRTQHQNELDELIDHVNQKTYAYADVRAQNQDLLMTITELKNKLKIVDKGKNVNTKFDKKKKKKNFYETSRTLLCVTPLPKNIAVKAKKVSNTKVNADRSKPFTSHSIPRNEQSKKHSANVIARGMYKITKTETQTLDYKSNINVSNSTGVESSNSVRRPKSKDNKSKDRVLKNTNDKRSSTHVRNMSSSVRIDSNKCETMHSNVCQSNASVFNTKTVNAVNDGSNIIYVSCGKDVFYFLMKTVLLVMLCLEILRNSWERSASGMITLQQSLDMEIMFKAIFRSNTCYVWNLEGDDLLTGSQESNLYTISISELVASSLVYLVDGLLKFKYDKDHLCSTCKEGKSKKASFPSQLVPRIKSILELIHMDLCGPIRVESINGKKYILVIVDDYSCYTWVYFLRSKYEALDRIINFINQVQRNLKAQILKIRTDSGTEFKNEKLRSFYAKLGIIHHTSIARTPEQNGVVERRNHTLVEAA